MAIADDGLVAEVAVVLALQLHSNVKLQIAPGLTYTEEAYKTQSIPRSFLDIHIPNHQQLHASKNQV